MRDSGTIGGIGEKLLFEFGDSSRVHAEPSSTYADWITNKQVHQRFESANLLC